MKIVEHLRIKPYMNVKDLASEFSRVGVIGGRRFAQASSIISRMFINDEFTNILALAGPLVPGGLRLLIRDLVFGGFINAIVSTGANITHDLIEAFGFNHMVGTTNIDDRQLRNKNIGRIYDILVDGEAFVVLEKKIHRLLDELNLSDTKISNLATYELLDKIGSKIDDENSIVRTCTDKGVCIFCPTIYDSMLGMNLWTYAQLKGLRLNPFLDFSKLVDLIFDAKKVGLIILGGGTPKHYSTIASILKGGVDLAVQVTMDRPEPGGLSGAPLEEAISWRKVNEKGEVATIIGDATVLFPMLIAAALPPENKKI